MDQKGECDYVEARICVTPVSAKLTRGPAVCFTKTLAGQRVDDGVTAPICPRCGKLTYPCASPVRVQYLSGPLVEAAQTHACRCGMWTAMLHPRDFDQGAAAKAFVPDLSEAVWSE